MRRLTHLIVLAAFVFSCGGQWYALQCVAWAKMIHDYSKVVPFAQAIGMTLSGQYPCALCKIIAEKKQETNDTLCSFGKYEKFLSRVSASVECPRMVPVSYADYRTSFSGRTEPPPTPPPRLVLI